MLLHILEQLIQVICKVADVLGRKSGLHAITSSPSVRQIRQAAVAHLRRGHAAQFIHHLYLAVRRLVDPGTDNLRLQQVPVAGPAVLVQGGVLVLSQGRNAGVISLAGILHPHDAAVITLLGRPCIQRVGYQRIQTRGALQKYAVGACLFLFIPVPEARECGVRTAAALRDTRQGSIDGFAELADQLAQEVGTLRGLHVERITEKLLTVAAEAVGHLGSDMLHTGGKGGLVLELQILFHLVNLASQARYLGIGRLPSIDAAAHFLRVVLLHGLRKLAGGGVQCFLFAQQRSECIQEIADIAIVEIRVDAHVIHGVAIQCGGTGQGLACLRRDGAVVAVEHGHLRERRVDAQATEPQRARDGILRGMAVDLDECIIFHRIRNDLPLLQLNSGVGNVEQLEEGAGIIAVPLQLALVPVLGAPVEYIAGSTRGRLGYGTDQGGLVDEEARISQQVGAPLPIHKERSRTPEGGNRQGKAGHVAHVIQVGAPGLGQVAQRFIQQRDLCVLLSLQKRVFAQFTGAVQSVHLFPIIEVAVGRIIQIILEEHRGHHDGQTNGNQGRGGDPIRTQNPPTGSGGVLAVLRRARDRIPQQLGGEEMAGRAAGDDLLPLRHNAVCLETVTAGLSAVRRVVLVRHL